MSTVSSTTFTAGVNSSQHIKLMPRRCVVSITRCVGCCYALEVWTGMMTGKPILCSNCTLIYFSLVSRVRRGLRDGTIKVKPDDFPHLLYRQETINQEDLFDGFLRNQLLVKVCCLHAVDIETDYCVIGIPLHLSGSKCSKKRWERWFTS
jgi:hypothetical protein